MMKHARLFSVSWFRTAATAATIGVLASCGGGEGDTAPATPANPVARLAVAESGVLLTGANQERQLSVQALDASRRPLAARVTWSSSEPGQVTVDANGRVRSVTPVGSAMVFAEADGIRSAPVFVSTVELRPGTLLLRDAEIVSVGAAINVAAGELPGLGALYDVVVSGVPAPAVGTLVLGIGSAEVTGRVTEAEALGNQVRIRLETVSAPDLLARYDVNWTIDLAAFDNVMDGEPLNATPRASSRNRVHAMADTHLIPEWKMPKTGTSPLSCEGSVKAALKTTPVEVKVTGSPKLEIVSSRLDAALPPGRLRVALTGPLVMSTRLGLTAEAGLVGEVRCELKSRIPLPVFPPPIGPFVRLAIPVGIGAAVNGEVQVASIDFSVEGKNGFNLELGVDCGPHPCKSLDKAERINEFTPSLKISSMPEEGLKLKLDAQVYFLSGLDVVALVSPLNIVDVKVGPKQAADFGSVKRQAADTGYASNYDLKIQLEMGPGSSLKKAIEKLMGGEDRGSLGFSFTPSYDLSESPSGNWQPDKSQAVPRRDTVNFRVNLKPSSTTYFAFGYNVKEVRLYRRLEGEMLFSHFRTFPIVQPGQTDFELQWQPTDEDAGKNEFAVFVTTNMIPVVAELEILPNSIRTVEVICVSVPRGASRRMTASASRCEPPAFSGTASGVRHGIDRFNATLTWKPDPVLNNDPAKPVGQYFFRPQGVVDFELTLYKDLGCDVSPKQLTQFDDSSLMMIDTRATTPPSYGFGVFMSAELTISCPNTPPMTVPASRVIAFTGSGQLSEDGYVIQGGTSTPQGSMSYLFSAAPPPPPPAMQ
jgi:hypothetical protein